MNEPTRLLDQAGTSPLSRELLEAISPPTAPPPAVHAALSQSLSSMVAASGAKAAATATLWLKLTIAFFAVLGVGGAVWWYQHRLPEPRANLHTPPQVASLAPAPALPSPEPVASASASTAGVAPSVTAPERAKPPSGPRDTLAEEEALLESARQAVAREPARALSLLQRHRAQFPTGQLAAERMYLSVDCLLRLGNRKAAEREARVLTKYYPSSAYARRAPMLLASPKR